jgi:hypothetical protein
MKCKCILPTFLKPCALASASVRLYYKKQRSSGYIWRNAEKGFARGKIASCISACVYALSQATIQKKLHTFLQLCNKNNTTINTTKKII